MSFRVIGDDDDDDDDFETAGDYEVVGEEVLGSDDLEIIGRAGRRRRKKRRALLLPPKMPWRQGKLAGGVWGPRGGLEPLPLTPDTNGGVFTAAVTTITWSARPQRPFRAERLLFSLARSDGAGPGTSNGLVKSTGIYVGTMLQQVELGQIDLENFTKEGFGVRLNLIPADPGILIQIPTIVTPAPTGTGSITCSLTILGQTLG